MARFAGSPSYQQRRKFEGPRLQSGSYRTNAGNAANWVSVGNIYEALNENTSDLGQVALTAMANKSRENIANATAEAFGISGFQDYMVKNEEADAAAKALRAEGSAKKKGGILSAVGGIASAAAPFAIIAAFAKFLFSSFKSAAAKKNLPSSPSIVCKCWDLVSLSILFHLSFTACTAASYSSVR